MIRRRTLRLTILTAVLLLATVAGCQHPGLQSGAGGAPSTGNDAGTRPNPPPTLSLVVRISPITYSIPAGTEANAPGIPGAIVKSVPDRRRKRSDPLPRVAEFTQSIAVPMYVAPVYVPVERERRHRR